MNLISRDLCIILLISISLTGCSTKIGINTKPNIIVIFADDLGYGDLGCYGETKFKTPAIDKLAREGFKSLDFFVPANVCSPSRAALLTGRYPMRCGYPIASNPLYEKYKNYGFSPDELTIPELLNTAGYQTLMVGKWHLGMDIKGSHPLDAGFDEYLGIPRNYDTKNRLDNNTLYRGKEVEVANISCEELTTRYTNEVVSFLKKNNDKPFFIYLSHHIAHSPHLPSNTFKGKSEKGEYGDFIEELDFSTGRIMKTLQETGLDDRTLVVFTSDNGPARLGSSGVLNGGKYSTMEGGHRVPGIFRWPGKIPANQISETQITSMDLLPLFCDLADVDLPQDRKIDGKNVIDILQGKTSETPHEYTYYYNGINLQAVRKENWKLHLPRTKEDQPFWSKVDKSKNNRKGFVSLDTPMLYDLETDLAERINVADKHPQIVSMLLKQAEIISKELGNIAAIGSDQRKIQLDDPQNRDSSKNQ